MNHSSHFSASDTPFWRITAKDRNYCITQQAAYHAARQSLECLQTLWEKYLQKQVECLADTDTSETLYLKKHKDMKITIRSIQNQREVLHRIFVKQLIHYFNEEYHIHILYEDIDYTLIPQAPLYHFTHLDRDAVFEQELREYHSKLLQLSLTYERVLEEIFELLEGRELSEQAVYEIRSNCDKATRFGCLRHYKLNKEILQFHGDACHYEHDSPDNPWKLNDDLIDIIKGISYFETDSVSMIPADIANLIRNEHILPLTLFSGCKKVKQMKLFKNGRADIIFTNTDFAKDFVKNYLRPQKGGE